MKSKVSLSDACRLWLMNSYKDDSFPIFTHQLESHLPEGFRHKDQFFALPIKTLKIW